ncbi:MAG: 50S ribosomal protein L23 [Bacteroidota bacterium]
MATKKYILIKPLMTEKSERVSDKYNQYCFVVDKRANKIEIAKAVEEMYSVGVASVNTSILPSKVKSRYTRSGVSKGRKPGYKKAFVKLVEGDEIDFFGDL